MIRKFIFFWGWIGIALISLIGIAFSFFHWKIDLDINKIVFHFVSSSNLFKEDFLEEIRSLYKDYSQILKHLDDLEQFINENS